MKPVVAAILATVLTQHVAVYRARHRPIAELAGLAESTLGSGGRIAVDSRTASLVLSGPREAVERALALLAQLDRPLRTVLIEHSLEELESLEAAGLNVEWSAGRGSLRVGRPVTRQGKAVAGSVSRRETARVFRARLRVLEGEPGLLVTGRSRVIPGSLGGELRAESGFEALPTLLETGLVHVELRPFAGRLESGGVRYTAAATALELMPGESIVVAEIRQSAGEQSLELPRGASRHESRTTRVLLLRVDVEP